MSWFAARPLFGQTVLVTRAEQQADGVCDQLTDLGASVLLQPAIQIGPVEDATPLQQAVAELDQYDWVVFSSRNGVEHFLRAIAVAVSTCADSGTANSLASDKRPKPHWLNTH